MALALAAPAWRAFQWSKPLAEQMLDLLRHYPRKRMVVEAVTKAIVYSDRAIVLLEELNQHFATRSDLAEFDAALELRFERMERAVNRVLREVNQLDFAVSQRDMGRASRAARRYERDARDALVAITAIALSVHDTADIDPATCAALSPDDEVLAGPNDDDLPPWDGVAPALEG